jgi:hypothetical protein
MRAFYQRRTNPTKEIPAEGQAAGRTGAVKALVPSFGLPADPIAL